jgi:purine-binding chemotaxis protein CheW
MTRNARLDWNLVRQRLEEIELSLDRPISLTAAAREKIFQARANLLVVPLQQAVKLTPAEVVLVFRVGAGRYAVALSQVAEVVLQPKVTPVPGSPDEIAGLIQVRGEIRPLYHLRRLLALPDEIEEVAVAATVLLLYTTGKGSNHSLLGVTIDGAEDIRVVRTEERQQPPAGSPHAAWVTQDLITGIEVSSLLKRDS